MDIETSTASVPDAAEVVPRLRDGERLSRAEFERRYAAHSEPRFAELIEGVVYVASPVSTEHAEPHSSLNTCLGFYRWQTPGVFVGDNETVRLSEQDEPQPDILLRIDPAARRPISQRRRWLRRRRTGTDRRGVRQSSGRGPGAQTAGLRGGWSARVHPLERVGGRAGVVRASGRALRIAGARKRWHSAQRNLPRFVAGRGGAAARRYGGPLPRRAGGPGQSRAWGVRPTAGSEGGSWSRGMNGKARGRVSGEQVVQRPVGYRPHVNLSLSTWQFSHIALPSLSRGPRVVLLPQVVFINELETSHPESDLRRGHPGTTIAPLESCRSSP